LGNLGKRACETPGAHIRAPLIKAAWSPIYLYSPGSAVPWGENISWEEFGRMLMTYEGFNFRMEIVDSTEDLT